MAIRPPRAVANRRILYSPECTACKMDIGVSDEEAVQTPCRHVYHAECMLMLVKTAVATTTLFPPRCCGQTIPTPLFEPYMSPELKDALTAREAEQTTPRRVYCANSPCSRFLGGQDDVLPVKLYSCNAPGCSTRTCARCRTAVDGCILPEAHVCAEDPAREETLHLGKRMGWTRCPRCTELVERKSGCPHMTCRCGGEFCYVCGELYSNCTCGSRSRAQDRGGATRRERGYFAPGHLEDLQRYLALPIELTDSDEA
ncbi:hypothetical protein BN946_scf184921.g35 [Trametes cinnabarina]|uniref:RBR-type E3 ubiquitin transferase n=1 Tax=Pycnoporus cinnabarinus TaxID=5643 RepID=A0A060SU69_PYCCI|nr:hypothetical protein BN946_scf184921.g35 [Trametes cinnabarina]